MLALEPILLSQLLRLFFLLFLVMFQLAGTRNQILEAMTMHLRKSVRNFYDNFRWYVDPIQSEARTHTRTHALRAVQACGSAAESASIIRVYIELSETADHSAIMLSCSSFYHRRHVSLRCRLSASSDHCTASSFTHGLRRSGQFLPLAGLCLVRNVFCVSSPNNWNSLPAHIRSSDSLVTFQSRLKSHLFSSAYHA